MNYDKENNPNHESSDANGHDESFVQQRLASLANPEPIDPQFVERLSLRLDSEFAAVVAGVTTDLETDFDHDGHSVRRPTEPLATAPIAKATRNGTTRRRVLIPRWLGAVVTAVLLLGVFSLGTMQPLTSWAEMIQMLKSTPWVQTDSGRTSSWFSNSNQVVARRDAFQTVFVSGSAGTYSSYLRKDAKIYQTAAADRWLPLETDLMTWLARSSNDSLDPKADWRRDHSPPSLR